MSQAVTKMEPAEHMPAPVTEGAAVLQMIERAARDPAIDINKLQQLMEMKVQMEARAAEREFDISMSEAQSDMRRVATDSDNSQTKSKYASYAALDRELRPIYTTHGFSLSFNTGEGAPEQCVRVICRVAHRAGHGTTYHVDMPADGKGAKGGDVMTKTHATGAAITYGMRYLLKMIFNIAVGQDDDDGNSASAIEHIPEEQAKHLRSIIDEVGADIRKFCAYFKIGALPDLPASRYQDAIRMLSQKKGAKR